MNLIGWYNKAFGVKKRRGKELNSDCPQCGHKDFHFNIESLVGFCHRANCHWSPTLEDLIDLAGYGPDEIAIMPDRPEEQKQVVVKLPGQKLCFYSMGQLMTHSQEALDYLLKRGISVNDVIRWNITFDGIRVYVPIMREGSLYNYIGRDITGTEERKYLYCTGVKTSHWMFGWDECKEWDHITLVENTFNSIAYRNEVNCTTNFGSYLSDVQLDLIRKSKVQTVGIMWDENTHKNAEKIVKRLRYNGIHAAYCWMPGQPDDHPKDEIVKIAKQLKSLAERNILEFDPYNIKEKKLASNQQRRQ